jgi:putative transposase
VPSEPCPRDSPWNESVTNSAAPAGRGYRHHTVPRSPRCNLPDGFFQVTARGVAGALIFVDDHDRQAFFLLQQQVSELWGWRVHAWCQMGTHYHLVVEAKREQMSYAVHRLNGLYAQRFNRRHERRGHLFENRFSSWVIHDEEHLRATIAYVLENPVRAGLCTDARDWLWSGSSVGHPADLAAAALS